MSMTERLGLGIPSRRRIKEKERQRIKAKARRRNIINSHRRAKHHPVQSETRCQSFPPWIAPLH
jgi:hypothetical protein